MTLVYSLITGALLGQRVNDRPNQPDGTICVLFGRGRGSHYVDVVASAVRLEVTS